MKTESDRVKVLEKKIQEQQEEIKRLNKKSKRTSFWLFWLLSNKNG